MIFLNKFSFCSVFIMFFLFFSCSSQIISTQNKNIEKTNMKIEKNEGIEFEEMRRLNFKIDREEVSVLKEFNEILNFYQKLENPKYPKSYPIPSLQEEESLIIIKPTLKKMKFGDLEIIKMMINNETLVIQYKEIENWEYKRDQVSDPIVIIKVSEKFKNINLTLK